MTDKHTPLTCDCHFEEHASPEWESPGFVFCPLHAAAPELLKALERLVGAFQDNPNKPRDSKDWAYVMDTDVFSAIPQARTAIKAAKGDA